MKHHVWAIGVASTALILAVNIKSSEQGCDGAGLKVCLRAGGSRGRRRRDRLRLASVAKPPTPGGLRRRDEIVVR